MAEQQNGIIDFANIFNVGGTERYEREEDILLAGKEVPKGGIVGEASLAEKPVVEEPEKPVVEQEKPEEDAREGVKKDAEAPVVVPPAKVDYKALIGALSKRGVLPDMVGVVFGKDDGTEVAYDEMEVPDEGAFLDVVATVLEGQKESMMADKVDVASISGFTRKLIEADKSGADVVGLLKEYERTQAPVEKLDAGDKSGQLKIIAHYVGLMGLPKDEAEDYYNSIVSKGDDYIEAKALKYKAELERRMDKLIEDETKRAAEQKAKDAEDFKKFKKSLRAAIQGQYQLNDAMVSKAMDFVLKPSKSDPRFSEANNRIKEMLGDPEQAPDLIMFLMDPAEFIRQKSNRKVVEEKRRTFKMITNTAKNRTTSPVDDRGEPKKGMSFEEIELNV